MAAIRVFISYSHDSPEHLQRVLELSNRLRSDGIDCHIDQYEVNPPEGWIRWMERQFKEVRFVLVVCTETYLRRYSGEEKPGSGLGAAWESMLTTNYIHDSGLVNDKFVPVLFRNVDEQFIPEPLRITTSFCLEKKDGYSQLFRRLLNIPSAEKPPLGDLKKRFGLRALGELPRQPTFVSFARDKAHYPVGARTRAPKSIPPSFLSNLPRRTTVVGRTRELSAIRNAVQSRARLVAVRGPAGIGKASLLLFATHQLCDAEFFKIAVWFPVRYSGLTYDDFLDEIAYTLEYPYPVRLKAEDKGRELNRALEGKKAILVIPDFDRITDPRVAEYFSSLPSDSQLLMSTLETAPDGATLLDVGPLDKPDAWAVARHELAGVPLEMQQQVSEPDLETICEVSSNCPLAIQWHVGLLGLADGPGVAFSDAYASSEPPPAAVDFAFQKVWKVLSPASRGVLEALAVFPASATSDALAVVSDLPQSDVQVVLSQLLASKLVLLEDSKTSHVRSYRIHRATSTLVLKMSQRDPQLVVALQSRLIDYFLSFVEEKGGLDKDNSLDDLAFERLNLVGIMTLCETLGRLREYVKFHRLSYHMLWARGFWSQNLENGRTAVSFARSLNDFEGAAWIHMESLGWTHFSQGDYPQARNDYLDAKQIISLLSKPPIEVKARIYNYLGRLSIAEEKYVQAIGLLWEGLRLSEDDLTTTFIESALGDAYLAQNERDSAVAHYNTALIYREKSHDTFRACSTRCDIAELSLTLGDTVRARAEFERSLRDADSVKRLDISARCHYGLGELARASGDVNAATKHLKSAVSIFDQLGMDREVERIRVVLDNVNVSNLGSIKPVTIQRDSGVDVVLVNSPREAMSSADRRCQDFRVPLGLLNIASFLKQRGVTAKIIDAEALAIGLADIVEEVRKVNPKIIGLNCHTLNRHVVYETVRTLRSVLPTALFVLGGAHPALAPQLTMRECLAVDVVVVGEGERVMYELCRRPAEIESIPGIFSRRNGKIQRSDGEMPRIQNLDVLGPADLDQLSMDRYLQYEESALPGLWKRGYVNASRGCRFKCSYCTEQSFWTGLTTFRTAASIAAEIALYRERYGVNRFYFYDDTLTDWPELDKFCKLAHDMGTLWSCSTRIDRINEPLLDTMARGGCREIAFGLESGSRKSLDRVRKGWQSQCSLQEVGKRITLCSRRQIVPRTHFMIGFPWEEKNDITETVQFAVSLKDYALTDANFFVVKVYPGTPFSDDVRQIQSERGLSDGQVYNAWSVYDWYTTKNPKVAAKLKRFNDIPEISMHPHCDSLSLRKLVRNAYEIFFGERQG